MKGSDIKEYPTEELRSKKKTLITIIVVLAILIVVYLIYFIYKLVSGTWEANNTLGSVGLGVIVVAISIITIQLSKVEKELKNRMN